MLTFWEDETPFIFLDKIIPERQRTPSLESLIPVNSREDLRFWLQENRKTEKSCWVFVSMMPNPDTLLYLDAVEEAVLPGMDHDLFRIDREIEQMLKEEKPLYENFMAFPDLYKRVRIDMIRSNRNQPELFRSRLDKFITNTRQNKMYG